MGKAKKRIVRYISILLVLLFCVPMTGTFLKANAVGEFALIGGMAHVQRQGDCKARLVMENGIQTLVLGSRGKSQRVERINVNIENNTGLSGTLQYRVHIQSIGWTDWVNAGSSAGTSGRSLRLEGIQFRLTGELADYYDVRYCAHIQNYGDNQGWVYNGALAGTTGESKRLEEIKVQIVKKGTVSTVPTVTYRVHVQSYGWENVWRSNGQVSGTSGQSKRLEAISMTVNDNQYGGGIEYNTHVQRIGWQGDVNNSATWKRNGELSGTSGKSYRLEAIQIKLTGNLANYYDVYYRVHAQNVGWLSWAKNGQFSGTSGKGYRLEAIQIVLRKKELGAPSSTYCGVKQDSQYCYVSNMGNIEGEKVDTNIPTSDNNNSIGNEEVSSPNLPSDESLSDNSNKQHVCKEEDFVMHEREIRVGVACNYCRKDLSENMYNADKLYECHGGWHDHWFCEKPRYYECKVCGRKVHPHYWYWEWDDSYKMTGYYKCSSCYNKCKDGQIVDYSMFDYYWSSGFDFRNSDIEDKTVYTGEVPDPNQLRGIMLNCIDRPTFKMAVGEKVHCNITYMPTSTQEVGVTYSSSDTNVLKVDESGEVTAVGVGKAYVTATSIYRDYKYDKKEFTVFEDKEGEISDVYVEIDGEKYYNNDNIIFESGEIYIDRYLPIYHTLNIVTTPNQGAFEWEYTCENEIKSVDTYDVLPVISAYGSGGYLTTEEVKYSDCKDSAIQFPIMTPGTAELVVSVRDLYNNKYQIRIYVTVQ